MHMLAEHTITIEQPVQLVYRYARDLKNFSKWFPKVIRVEATGEYDGVTREYRETLHLPLRGEQQVLLKIVAEQDNRSFASEGQLASIMPRMEMAFNAQTPQQTRVTWRMFSRKQGSLFFRIALLPLVRATMRARAKLGLVQLKHILESQ